MYVREKTTPYSYPRGMVHVLRFDSDIDEPEHYSQFCDVLLAAGEEDIVEIYFSTGGGNGSTMVSLINLLRTCRAETHGYLLSEASSAGSYLFLCCDNHHVGKYTTMLCHQVSYGVRGSHHEIKAAVDHYEKEDQRLAKEVYKNFLSDDEIEELLKGRQIYLDDSEIVTRLENRIKQSKSDEEQLIQEQLEEEFPDYEELPDDILMKLTKANLIKYLKGEIGVSIENGKPVVVQHEI